MFVCVNFLCVYMKENVGEERKRNQEKEEEKKDVETMEGKKHI